MTETEHKPKAVSAKVAHPFHGIRDADGNVGWAQRGETLSITADRRAELVDAGLVEREKGDAPLKPAEPEALDAPADKSRKLHVQRKAD
jgi:hypothetical protein